MAKTESVSKKKCLREQYRRCRRCWPHLYIPLSGWTHEGSIYYTDRVCPPASDGIFHQTTSSAQARWSIGRIFCGDRKLAGYTYTSERERERDEVSWNIRSLWGTCSLSCLPSRASLLDALFSFFFAQDSRPCSRRRWSFARKSGAHCADILERKESPEPREVS